MAVGSKAELHRNLPGRALVYMVLGVASFSLLDAGAKWLTQSYGIAQIIFLGRIFTLALVLAVALPRGGIGQFPPGRPGRPLARAITSVLTMAPFFWAPACIAPPPVVGLTF